MQSIPTMATENVPPVDVGLRTEVEGREVLDDIGLDESDIEWRKKFVGFDEDDERRLARMTPLFDSLADELAEEFYDHLTGFPESVEVLERSDRTIEQLKRTQKRYVRSLGEYAYDETTDPGYGLQYFRQRATIGRLHSMLDMPAKQYIGATLIHEEVLIDALFDHLVEGLRHDLDGTAGSEVVDTVTEMRDDLMSFLKIMNLDLQVAMDTYQQSESRGVWINALEEMMDPVIVINESGDVVVFNEAMESLTGLSAREAKGMETWEIFRTDETHDTKQTAIDIVKDTEEPIRGMELELLNHRDKVLDVKLNNAPMYDEDGEFVGAVSVIRNVTELRDKERALAEANEQVSTEIGSLADEQRTLAGDIADRMDELEADAAEQTSMAGEMQTKLEEFNSRMESVAASAEEVTNMATESRREVESGQEASREAKAAVNEIVTQADQLVDTATELDDRMDEIDDIVDVIGDVAKQTNLLALNARIEAARINDSGGLEVVADEVKSLADETKQHTEIIAGRIEGIREQTNATVEAARNTNDRVSHADDEIDAALDSFGDIAAAVGEAVEGISEIADANDEQAQRVDEMVRMADSYAAHSTDARETAAETTEIVENQVETAERIRTNIDNLSDRITARTNE